MNSGACIVRQRDLALDVHRDARNPPESGGGEGDSLDASKRDRGDRVEFAGG